MNVTYLMCVPVYLPGSVQEVARRGDIFRGAASHPEGGLETASHPNAQGVILYLASKMLDFAARHRMIFMQEKASFNDVLLFITISLYFASRRVQSVRWLVVHMMKTLLPLQQGRERIFFLILLLKKKKKTQLVCLDYQVSSLSLLFLPLLSFLFHVWLPVNNCAVCWRTVSVRGWWLCGSSNWSVVGVQRE